MAKKLNREFSHSYHKRQRTINVVIHLIAKKIFNITFLNLS